MIPRRSLHALSAILAATMVGLHIPAAGAASPYSIDQLTLGERLQPDRDFQCEASKYQAGFTWCQKSRQERSRRGAFNSTISTLQDPDHVAVYLNRLIEPAFFGPNDIREEIARLSNAYFSGERARVIRLPPREGLPDAVIALWGKIELEPLDNDALAKLASEDASRQSLLVDYLGDLRRSAKLGLPVFRLGGGAGYLWSASVNPDGRGHLRFLTADPSALVPKPAVRKPVAEKPPTAKPVAQQHVTPKPADPTPAEKPHVKIVSVHPIGGQGIPVGVQPLPNVIEVPPNTTIRAKTVPDRGELITGSIDAAAAQPRSAAKQSAVEQVVAVQDAERPAPTGHHRTGSIAALIGLIALGLFLLARLMESWKRPATGLELLESEKSR